MNARWWSRVAQALLWVPVIVYAVLVTRQFFHYTDAGVYLSSDDGVANISYALATEGRYGFLSSPILAGLPRHDGLFSYGPFYFYAGAALIWLFGYNLTLLRFIHLAVMLTVAASARAWFGGAAGGAAAALTAIGVLMTFERAHWPMARPDSMVSLFAVALVVSAGAGIRSGRARYWFLAGLFGACGAFTHLVAWSLIPAVVVILGVGLLAAARDDERRWRLPQRGIAMIAATALGGITGTALFYASFDFRFQEQWMFLTDYQRFTGSMGGGASPAFSTLVSRHFEQAYWYLPYPLGHLVWPMLGVATTALIASLAARGARWRRVLALVAPPTIVWVSYLLSLGVYNNFHSGYAILNQVMWLWTGGALVAAGLVLVEGRRLQAVASAAVWGVAAVLALGMLTFLAARTDYRALAAASRVPIHEYSERVLHALPVRARAWGSVEFAIEHPNRVQLVQFWDAIKIVETIGPSARELAPDYLVWGPVENGGSTREVLAAADRVTAGAENREIHVGPQRLQEAFPEARYTLMSLVAGPPYGVTRVYAWSQGAPALAEPMVAVFDPERRQWSTATGPSTSLVLHDAAPATMTVGVDAAATTRTALQTVQGTLDAGLYLLRVGVSPNLAPGEPLVMVAAAVPAITEDASDASRGIDVGPWFSGEPYVYLIYLHGGGPVFVSQFGTGAAGIASVDTRPILTLADYANLRRPPQDQPIPVSAWTAAFPALAVSKSGSGQANVQGDATQFGYQAYGPRIEVSKGMRMRIRVPVTVTAGRACFGVLDGTEERWLIAPDRLLPEYEFVINDSRTIKPVLANCNGVPDNIAPTRATIGPGSYASWPDREELYVDQLMREFRNARPR